MGDIEQGDSCGLQTLFTLVALPSRKQTGEAAYGGYAEESRT